MKTKVLLFLFLSMSVHVALKAQDSSVKKAIQDLVNTVSRQGSVKLTAAQKTQMADWLKVNAESITNVRPWKISGEGPSMKDSSAAYTNADFKFAEGNNVLYVFSMDVPQADMKIKSLCTSVDGKIVGTVKLLGSDERMSWEQQERELNLEKPHVLPKDGVTVFKITWTEYYKELPIDKSIKILTP